MSSWLLHWAAALWVLPVPLPHLQVAIFHIELLLGQVDGGALLQEVDVLCSVDVQVGLQWLILTSTRAFGSFVSSARAN